MGDDDGVGFEPVADFDASDELDDASEELDDDSPDVPLALLDESDESDEDDADDADAGDDLPRLSVL